MTVPDLEQLQNGIDYRFVRWYNNEDIPKNSFVVKVNKSVLKSSQHQKLPVYQDENGALLIEYFGRRYVLMSGTTFANPRGVVSGNFTSTTLSITTDQTYTYRGEFAHAILPLSSSVILSSLVGCTTNTPFVPVAGVTYRFILPSTATPMPFADVSGFKFTEVHRVKLPSITTPDEFIMDEELVIPVPTAALTVEPLPTSSNALPGLLSRWMIYRPILKISDNAMLIESNMGGWIDQLTGKRVEYVGLSAPGVYSIVNGNNVPPGYPTPDALGLQRIILPPPPVIGDSIAATVAKFVDIKSVMYTLGAVAFYQFLRELK